MLSFRIVCRLKHLFKALSSSAYKAVDSIEWAFCQDLMDGETATADESNDFVHGGFQRLRYGKCGA